jgi:hypothetical protein
LAEGNVTNQIGREQDDLKTDMNRGAKGHNAKACSKARPSWRQRINL